MAQVTVTINGRNYEIACDGGEEAHLTRLAQYVNRRVDELVANVGQVGDARLLVMASLLVADELSEVHAELEAVIDQKSGAIENILVTDDVISLTTRIEKIAEKLEGI